MCIRDSPSGGSLEIGNLTNNTLLDGFVKPLFPLRGDP